MLQDGDRVILVNVAKVVTVLIVIAILLIFVAGYVGGGM